MPLPDPSTLRDAADSCAAEAATLAQRAGSLDTAAERLSDAATILENLTPRPEALARRR